MRLGPLQELREAARSLAGEKRPVPLPQPALRPLASQRALPARGSLLAAAEARALRGQVSSLLKTLAARCGPALEAALLRARGAWDQIDALRLVDHRVGDDHARLRHDGQRALASRDAELSATAAEALWTAEAAMALVELLERRLATLVRLRLRSAPDLLVDGRPFLDVARALEAAARSWG